LRVLRHIGADDEFQYASSAFLACLSNTAYRAADSTAKEEAFPDTYMVHPPSYENKTNHNYTVEYRITIIIIKIIIIKSIYIFIITVAV